MLRRAAPLFFAILFALAACSPPDAVPDVVVPDASRSEIASPQVASVLGEPILITAQLRDADGAPVAQAGHDVTFAATMGGLSAAAVDDGWSDTETVQTDGTGLASVRFTPGAPGTVTVRAFFGTDTRGAPMGGVSVTVASGVVEVDDVTVVYDGAPHAVAPRFFPPDASVGATVAYALDGTPIEGRPTDAGTYTATVTAGDGFDGEATATLTIEPRPVVVTDVAWADKPYDATTAATADDATLDTANLVDGDDVALAIPYAGAFASAATGTHAVTGVLALAGDDAANYVVEPQPTGEATIGLADATLDGAAVQAKTYDGTTAATVTGTLAGIADGDDVAFTATFATAGAGTDVPVTVTLTGDDAASYALAPLALSGDVAPAPLTITPDAGQGKTVGEADPSFAYGATGFVGGDDASLLSGDLVRAAGESVGAYAFGLGTLSAGPDYALSLALGAPEFQIAVATLTVTPDADQAKAYGDAEPAFTFTVEDGVAVIGALGRDAGDEVGAYAFTLGTLSAGPDYDLVLAEDAPTFAVTPARLAVVAGAGQTKTYGQADPDFVYAASGFVAGDDADVLSGHLGREAGEGVGTYALTVGTLTAGPNYALDFESASFEVSPAPLTITPDAGQAKLVGDADPTFTYAVSGLVAGDTASVLTGALGREAGEAAGAYPFTLGDLTAADYAPSLAGDATFAIGAVVLEGATVTYDGTSRALTPAFAPDAAAVGASVTYRDADGAELPGAPRDAGTYTVTATAGSGYPGTATATLVVEPRALTVTNVEFADKVYDAGTGATLGATLVTTNAVQGDDVQLVDRLVGTFASASVGTHDVVGTLELTGADAANYVVDPQPVGTASITLRDVTLQSAVAEGRPYDGTNGATVTGELVGVRPADLGDIGYGATFAQAGVGTDLQVAVTLTGDAAGNYRLADPGLTATIAPRAAIVTIDDLDPKTYGEALVLGTTSRFVAENLVDGETIDAVTLSSDGATAEAPVGTYEVHGADPTGTGFVPANYTVQILPGDLVVTKRPVTITAATTTWTYGDAPAQGDLDPQATDGGLPLPAFAHLAGTLDRTTVDVGAGLAFAAGTLDIVDGTDHGIAANFDVTLGTYAVTPRPATVTVTYAGTKTYGDAIDPTGLGGGSLSAVGLADGESIDGATFSSDGFAADAPVTATPYPVHVSDLTGAGFVIGNYDLTYAFGSVTVQPRTVTLAGAFTTEERAYDGTTAAPIADASGLALVNAIDGDDVAPSPVAAYGDARVGEGKIATLTDASGLTGDDAANYVLSLDGAPTSTGRIVEADIAFDVTIAGTDGAKTVVYDGGTTFQPSVTSSLAPIPDDQPVAFIVDIRHVPTGESRGSFRDVGQYEVTVTADDPRYLGQSVVNDLYVLAREVVIAPSATAKTYGDPNPELLPVVDAGSPNGLGASDAFAGGELAYAGSTEANLAVGTYPFDLGAVTIERGGVDVTANYAVTFASDFTVEARTLTITPDAGQEKTYGEADPVFGYQSSGFATGDDASLLGGELARDAGEDVGTYAFTLGTLDAGANYALTLPAEAATFEVTPRPIVLTATTTDVTYGDTGHDLTAVLFDGSSLRRGDVLGGALAMGTTDAGTWTFGIGGATLTRDDVDVSANYIVTLWRYTIRPRDAVVVPDSDQAKTYGDDDPPLTYTVQNLLDGDAFEGTLSRAPGEDVGTYAITLGDLANANYALTLAGDTVTFEITPRAITLGGTVATKAFSDDDPDLAPVLLNETTLRDGDVLTGALAHAGVDVGTYDLAQGDVTVVRDDVDVTANYALSFGTFTIEPKPVSFAIVNADATIVDGASSAEVFFGDGTSAIRGLEVESTPAGMTSFRFSYRRTHDENHDPVPSGQQSVQNINLLGSYVVTVTATDPNYVGATPIDVWVTDVSEAVFTDESVNSAVLGFDALVTVELRNGDGVARAAGSVGLPLDLAVRDGATATVAFRDADDTEAITGLTVPAGSSRASYRVVPETDGVATLTATPVTSPDGAVAEASLAFDAILPTLTAVADGPYDVVAGGTREILISELLSNDTWDGVGGFELTGVTAQAGVTATVSGDRIVVAAAPDAGNTTARFDYRVATTGAYATGAIASVAIEVTLAPVEALLFTVRSEADAFMATDYTLPTFEEVFASWPRFSASTYYTEPNAGSTWSGGPAYWTYDATSERVEYTYNGGHDGIVSPDAIEYFTFEGTVQSTDTDDDSIGLIAAFRAVGSEPRYLVAHRTNAGNAPSSGWGLSLVQGGSRYMIAEPSVAAFETYGNQASGQGWSQSGASRIRVERTGNVVRIAATDWFARGGTAPAYDPQSEITLDLATGDVSYYDGSAWTTRTTGYDVAQFLGAQQYGYYVQSQADTTYVDIDFEGGVARDTVVYLDEEADGVTSYASEIYRFAEGAWTLDASATIQTELDYPRTVTSVAETSSDLGASFRIHADRVERIDAR